MAKIDQGDGYLNSKDNHLPRQKNPLKTPSNRFPIWSLYLKDSLSEILNKKTAY
jgi:hypothetical protein